MFDRLFKILVAEVPEELSVCEFECPKANCTGRDWAACTLRNQATPHGNRAIQYTVRPAPTEVPASVAVTNKALSSI